ncbi:MAG: hypothetical protein LBL26_12345 [Peptococcaceae bacterium]|nr:hypothetical protein [Peptococcaceae bacterium]
MNYEDFYGEYAAADDALKERISSQQKLLTRIRRNMANGDIKSASRDLPAIQSAASENHRAVSDMVGIIQSADMRAYLESGDFARQLIELCRENGVDIQGEGTTYEVFPYRLKIDAANADLQINGRKAIGLRPRALTAYLAKQRAKLLSAAFNPVQYAAELAAAYDLALLDAAKSKTVAADADIYLATLYKYLTPMRRFRREYNTQAYALDLARLYAAESNEAGDGRRFQFGPSRDNAKAIRIVDMAGNEHYLATIRFYRE